MSKKPNIISLHVDQLKLSSIGAYGCRHVKTPWMNRIIKDGLNFMRSYATVKNQAPITKICRLSVAAVLLAGFVSVSWAQEDRLLENKFMNPPKEVRPHAWFHWMHGNLNRDGLEKDINAMADAGLGGFHIFNIGMQHAPKGAVDFMSRQWRELFQYSLKKAAERGMDVGLNNSDGWAATGGPWIDAEHSMQMPCWTETAVSGGKKIRCKLPQPFRRDKTLAAAPAQKKATDAALAAAKKQVAAANRAYQTAEKVAKAAEDTAKAIAANAAISAEGKKKAADEAAAKRKAADAAKTALTQAQQKEPQAQAQINAAANYYRDVAVLAIREEEGAGNLLARLQPEITNGFGSPFNPATITDGDWYTSARFNVDGKQDETFVQFTFAEPVPARSVRVVFSKNRQTACPVLLTGSNDGISFEPLTMLQLPLILPYTPLVMSSANFESEPFRYYRFVFQTKKQDKYLEIGELRLSGNHTVERLPKYAGFCQPFTSMPRQSDGLPDHAIQRDDILDLTDLMAPDGTLHWDAPQGDWTLIRFGHTTTGREVNPATDEGRGYECDKFSRAALKLHFDQHLSKLVSDAGPLLGKTLKYFTIDSFEVGNQNWTPHMEKEFNARAGYALRTWLPVLTGRVIGSRETTDRFLWDFRRVLANLFLENYYTYFDELSKQYGISTCYQGYGSGNFNNLEVGGRADVPQTEFWISNAAGVAKTQKMTSAAHIYGKPRIGAEAFSAFENNAGWRDHPRFLKKRADWAFAQGINMLFLHSYLHNPWPEHVAPGMTLGRFGTTFGRISTWWEMGASSFFDYLSRCQLVLQSGLFVADVAVFTPEHQPELYVPVDLPEGYRLDYLNTEVLQKRMSVQAGRLVLPDGMSYTLLYLPPEDRMTLPALQRISELVEQGATVVGKSPQHVWGLHDYLEQEKQLKALAKHLWGVREEKVRKIGKGTVINTSELHEAFDLLQIQPDCRFDSQGEATPLFIHRRIGEIDAYFLANQEDKEVNVRATFRSAGSTEKWNPVTGEISGIESLAIHDTRSEISLRFDPLESMFILFRPDAVKRHEAADLPRNRAQQPLPGPWTVSFDPRWKAPESVEFPELISWTEHDNEFIKYYSGTATYKQVFNLSSEILNLKSQIQMDLGQVGELARVRLNGKDLGAVWTKPFRVDISDAIQSGQNQLEIDVVNLWVNRLIGDEQYPDDREWLMIGNEGGMTKGYPDWFDRFAETGWRPVPERLTYANYKHFKKDSPLPPSGLLGPVVIHFVSK